MARRFQSIHTGHVDIQNYDIRLKVLRPHHGVGAIGSIANYIKVGLRAQKPANRLPRDRMIIYDENVCSPAHTRPILTLAADYNTSYTLHRLEPKKIEPTVAI